MISRRLKQIIVINIYASFIFSLLYIVFLLSTLWDFKLFVIASLITIPYLIFSIISYFKESFFPFLPFFLNLLLVTLLAIGNGTVKLYVFLIAPVIIAMYYGSKRLNRWIVAFNILCFFGYLVSASIINGNTMPKLILFPIVGTLPYIMEIISVIWLAKRFIIDSEQVRKQNEIYTSIAFSNSSMTIQSFRSFFSSKSVIVSQHAENVLYYTSIILDELSKNEEFVNILTPDYVRYIENGAFLHDLGRICFDNSIAEKFFNYTDEEMELVNKMPEKGVLLFSSLPQGLLSLEEKEVITNIIYQCHEFFDSTGFPKKLSRRQISFEAQIVCVAEYLDSQLLISNADEKSKTTFNDVYMSMITKGYDKFNQDVVSAVYERRSEIIDYCSVQNGKLQELLKNQ